jgi:glycosyltransferase involved in cell wall biosynthesis
MIILHVIPTVNPEFGGPIEGIFISAPVLREQGCNREIVSLDAPGDPWVKNCPLPVYPLGIQSPGYARWRKRLPFLNYGYTPHFVPWLKENARKYDAVIVNGLWSYAAMGSSRALPNSDTPYFVYPHGMLDPYFNKIKPVKRLIKQFLWWISEGRLLANANAVFFVTEEELRLANNAFWPFRCRGRVVAYGTQDIKGDAQAQIAAFRSACPSLGNRRFLLYLSRIHPKKGCDLLVEAFAKVAHKDPDVDLVIAGPDSVGWIKKLQAAAENAGIGKRIHWPGMLKGDLKWGAFRGSDAFVLPSHQENFGIVIAEAMACGRPVLTTDKVNTWREVVASGGGIVEPDDLPGVTRLLEQFFDLSPEEKTAMGQRSRQGFLDKFDISTMGPQLIEAIRCSGKA